MKSESVASPDAGRLLGVAMVTTAWHRGSDTVEGNGGVLSMAKQTRIKYAFEWHTETAVDRDAILLFIWWSNSKYSGWIFISKPETDKHLTFVARQTKR
jgi:hypothetical protein